MGWAAPLVFTDLSQMWRQHDIRLPIKIRVFNTPVMPVLLHGIRDVDVEDRCEDRQCLVINIFMVLLEYDRGALLVVLKLGILLGNNSVN